jgi:Uma2 family endonuclease
LLWSEIVSPDDKLTDVWDKARNAIGCGTPYVWIIDSTTLESELWTARGSSQIADQTLRLPNSPILIPLADALEE